MQAAGSGPPRDIFWTDWTRAWEGMDTDSAAHGSLLLEEVWETPELANEPVGHPEWSIEHYPVEARELPEAWSI